MDLIKVSGSTRVVVKENVSNHYFINLMKRARSRFGLKSNENPNGFIWPNAHKYIFKAGGFEYRLEVLGDLDMDFIK